MVRPLLFLRAFLEYLLSAGMVLLLLLFTFAVLTCLLWHYEPGAAHFRHALFLSATTALTIGYGDLQLTTVPGHVAVVGLGLLGITFTGLVVAAVIKAMEAASPLEQNPR